VRKRFTSLLLIAAASLLGAPKLLAQSSFSVLHSFTSATTDGANPEGQPMLFGSNLVGLAYNGGANGFGALFQVSTNGSGFNLLYSFEGDLNGANPFGILTLSGNSFYGMTFNGGIDDGGVIYRVRTNGSNYAVLHTFQGGDTDGQYPFGSLTVNGPLLFGMTANGGTNSGGVIFKIGTNGVGFAVIHSFNGGPNDGSFPSEGVTASGANLYGTTFLGGSNNIGTVFSMGTNGVGFKVLHHFGSITNDGANPSGPLTLVGSSLYGITSAGGTTNLGTVFTIGTDGTGYSVLHSFTGGTNDGAAPQYGPLIVTNNTIYGVTENGGTNDEGVVFQVPTTRPGFAMLYSFGANATDGAFPLYPPILPNANFYGVTVAGGSNNLGVVYGPGATSVVTTSPPPSQVCVTVPGAASAGVVITNVVAGQFYLYQASGCVGRNLDGTTDDPDGNEYNNNCTVPLTPNLGPAGPAFTCPGLIKFSLVGKYADGSSVQLGQNTNQDGYFIPPVSGPLTLFFNDDIYSDNSGSFTACITATNLPTICATVGGGRPLLTESHSGKFTPGSNTWSSPRAPPITGVAPATSIRMDCPMARPTPTPSHARPRILLATTSFRFRWWAS